MFQTQINPPAIVQYISGYEAEVLQEFESSSAANPMELVKAALIKRISEMREFNKRLDQQYPDLLSYEK